MDGPLDSPASAKLGEPLCQSEDRFRLLVESFRDYAILLPDLDGHMPTWNPGGEQTIVRL